MEEGRSTIYSVKLDPQEAISLARKGGTFLLLDVPEKTSVGLDQHLFVVGPRFKGMKMVPPGMHFLYYTAVNKEGNECSPITGFFTDIKPGQVVVRRWDVNDECLKKLEDSDEEERFIAAVTRFEMDSSLGPYNLQSLATWQKLSNYITPSLVEKLEPVGGNISIMNETEWAEEQVPQTRAERSLAEQLAAAREKWDRGDVMLDAAAPSTSEQVPPNKTGGRCFYSKLPRLIKGSKGVLGSDLSALNLDKSTALEQILKEKYESKEEIFLGEFQFSFVAFLFGQSLESFGQWKAIVHLMCGCFHSPLHLRTQLFTKWLEVVFHQLKFGLSQSSASDSSNVNLNLFFDSSWLAEDNFLQSLFAEWFTALRDAQQIDSALLRQATRLRKLLESSLGWDLIQDPLMFLDNEDDEYAPVVVTLDES